MCGISPLFSNKQKSALETLAVVPPDGYVLAPGNLLANSLMRANCLVQQKTDSLLNKVGYGDPMAYPGSFL